MHIFLFYIEYFIVNFLFVDFKPISVSIVSGVYCVCFHRIRCLLCLFTFLSVFHNNLPVSSVCVCTYKILPYVVRFLSFPKSWWWLFKSSPTLKPLSWPCIHSPSLDSDCSNHPPPWSLFHDLVFIPQVLMVTVQIIPHLEASFMTLYSFPKSW